MFVECDFESLSHAAGAAQNSGKEPVLDNFERFREAAVRRKILQRQVLEVSEKLQNPAYVELTDGLMEGFYIIDIGMQVAYRWEAEDAGEVPFIPNPPVESGQGIPMVCGTCQWATRVSHTDVTCTKQLRTTTLRHVCTHWVADGERF